MNLNDKKVLVVGLGDSGVAAARLCATQGAQVTVTDSKDAHSLSAALDRLSDSDVTYQLQTPVPDGTGYDLIVRSPGVEDTLPTLTAARAEGIEVWSEIELAFQLCDAPVIAVTGTNGKGTTTSLIAATLNASGRKAHLLGNIGTPFAEVLPQISSEDIVVLEVSAAQLQNSPGLAPSTAVLTNIRPEHLQLYSWEQYLTLKGRLVQNNDENSTTVVVYSDENCRHLTKDVPGKTVMVDTQTLPEGVDGVFIDDEGRLIVRRNGNGEVLFDTADTKALGVRASLPAAVAVALEWGVPAAIIAETMLSFKGREHVLEYADTINGVRFVNDAKGTNPWSTLHGLQHLNDGPTILIAGGKDDKEGDFNVLSGSFDPHVSHVFAFGPTARRVQQAAARSGADVTIVEDFREATHEAIRVARPGHTVLFSPGTHSWDIDPGYLERGEIFKKMVAEHRERTLS